MAFQWTAAALTAGAVLAGSVIVGAPAAQATTATLPNPLVALPDPLPAPSDNICASPVDPDAPAITNPNANNLRGTPNDFITTWDTRLTGLPGNTVQLPPITESTSNMTIHWGRTSRDADYRPGTWTRMVTLPPGEFQWKRIAHTRITVRFKVQNPTTGEWVYSAPALIRSDSRTR